MTLMERTKTLVAQLGRRLRVLRPRPGGAGQSGAGSIDLNSHEFAPDPYAHYEALRRCERFVPEVRAPLRRAELARHPRISKAVEGEAHPE